MYPAKSAGYRTLFKCIPVVLCCFVQAGRCEDKMKPAMTSTSNLFSDEGVAMLQQAYARRGRSALLRASGCNCHDVSLLPCVREPLMSKHCFVMGTQDCRGETVVFLT